MKALALAAIAASLSLPALAAEQNYAQSLVDGVAAHHPEAAVIDLVVTPPKAMGPVVVASNAGHSGAISGGYGVELPLLDANRRQIGTLGITGADDKAAGEIRDWLARRISHLANLLEPATYDASISANSLAQKLVDAEMAKHKSVVILALHVKTATNPDYPIVGSNIGRYGKKADEDDMHVIDSGESKLEYNEQRDRYEVEEPLLDSAGKTIGAVGVVFAYHEGDDVKPHKAEADAIQKELAKQIPSSAKLTEALPPLKKIGFTELKGYEGDFDHISADLRLKRLLLAAEDHGTIEEFTLDGKHVKTVKGVETPHAFLPLPDKNLLLVTDSGKGGSKLFDYATLTAKGSVAGLGLGADSMEYDSATGHAFINTGGKDADMQEAFLEELDPASGTVVGKVKFASNSLQSMALDPSGKRVFVMDQGNNALVTVDRATRQVTATWPIKDVGQAAMLQFDAANQRLIVGTRKPGRLIVLDANSGKEIANLAGPEKCDQLIYDAASHRIYMLGGEGNIVVYQQTGADTYAELAKIPSAQGAKTGLLVPALHRLYVAVSPGEGKSSGGGILQFDVE